MRKIGVVRLLHMILHRIYCALQLHIDRYYDAICEDSVSKQAFSAMRQNLNPAFIREIAEISTTIAAEDETLPCYHGKRLIALDGSDVALENTPELKKAFGCSGPKKQAATALCSIAFGPLDHVIYDFQIDRYECDERDLAKRHVNRLTELGLLGSLLLFDRWYPSAEFIGFLYETGFDFVMRVRRKWNVEADEVKTQKWITIITEGKPYPVRVLKVVLPTGEIETLLTSLNQKELPIRDAGALYFQRWSVETEYDLLKSKLQLENFSGKTKTTVLQDFYATMYLANLTAFICGCADADIAATDAGKNLKYARQSNHNRAIAKLREEFIALLLESNAALRRRLIDRMIAQIARYPVSIVPGRSPTRKLPRSKRFHLAKKAVVGLN